MTDKTTKDAIGVYGRDDLMAIAAFRYCLGRSTYIVSDCADWLIAHWPAIKDTARNVIRSDLEDAFRADDAARIDERDYKPLGWDCDREQWERVRRLWSVETSVKGKP
jgi:hypothetical protein